MRGYRSDPEQTAEAIDADGWLHTGDIAEIDSDGYVKIVDRKKELIINAAGKNMSPANIEAQIKSASPLIGQAIAIGDRRPYNVALIVLDPDSAGVWGAEHGLDDAAPATLAGDPGVKAEIARAVDEANTHLSRVEQIKRFAVLPVRLAAGRRGADADHEAQAQADRREVRGGDREAVPRRQLAARSRRYLAAQPAGERQSSSGKRAKSRSKLTHSQPCSIASAAR